MGKKLMSALLAGALALSMCGTALAAGNTESGTENSKATIEARNGVKVTFSTDATTPDLIDVTYENPQLKDGDQFVVLMVKGDENADITQNSILYIDQVAAQGGKIEFKVYPSSIQNSIIAIYGIIPQEGGEPIQKLVAAIVKGKFVLGDVDNSGRIDIGDAMAILQALASTVGEISKDDPIFQAADFDESGKVDIGDAMSILQYLAGITI